MSSWEENLIFRRALESNTQSIHLGSTKFQARIGRASYLACRCMNTPVFSRGPRYSVPSHGHIIRISLTPGELRFIRCDAVSAERFACTSDERLALSRNNHQIIDHIQEVRHWVDRIISSSPSEASPSSPHCFPHVVEVTPQLVDDSTDCSCDAPHIPNQGKLSKTWLAISLQSCQ